MKAGIIGKGQLQHHFWGDYCATICIQWYSPAIALQSLAAFPQFSIHPRESRAIVFSGGGKDLKAAEASLRDHGADMRKVGSLAKSIDFGEVFSVSIPTDLGAASDTSEQLGLGL